MNTFHKALDFLIACTVLAICFIAFERASFPVPVKVVTQFVLTLFGVNSVMEA